MRLNRSLIGLLVGTALLAGPQIASISTAPSAQADSSYACTSISGDKPHYSSGAQGVIAKARFGGCRAGTDAQVQIDLWVCPNSPAVQTKQWVSNNCTLKAFEFYPQTHDSTPPWYFRIPASNEATRYVPDDGKPGLHGSGWWVAISKWQTRAVGQSGDYITQQGEIVQVSATRITA